MVLSAQRLALSRGVLDRVDADGSSAMLAAEARFSAI
jgi:hypothetical protein